MRTPKHLVLVAVAAALTLAACDVVDDLLGEATEDPEASETAETVDDSSDEEATAATEDIGEAEAAPEEPPAEVEETEPRFAYPDADPIELATPGAGEGAWPELSWEPVDGAERYSVTLYAASGEAYWRWSGEDTRIRVGAFPEEPVEGAPLGPRVHEDMSWDVLARDDDGSVIAQSGERPISP